MAVESEEESDDASLPVVGNHSLYCTYFSKDNYPKISCKIQVQCYFSTDFRKKAFYKINVSTEENVEADKCIHNYDMTCNIIFTQSVTLFSFDSGHYKPANCAAILQRVEVYLQ